MTDTQKQARTGLRGLLDRWRAFANRLMRAQTIVLLTLVYVFLIVPMGLFMRLIGRSPLRQPREGPDSAWTVHADEPYTIERFKRLF